MTRAIKEIRRPQLIVPSGCSIQLQSQKLFLHTSVHCHSVSNNKSWVPSLKTLKRINRLDYINIGFSAYQTNSQPLADDKIPPQLNICNSCFCCSVVFLCSTLSAALSAPLLTINTHSAQRHALCIFQIRRTILKYFKYQDIKMKNH